MKYLKVAGPGRPKAEGRHHQETRRGEEGRSLIRCVLPFWSLSLRPNLAISFSNPLVLQTIVLELRSIGFADCRSRAFSILGQGFIFYFLFFFLQVMFLSLFQHLLVFGCTVCWFMILVYQVLVFFFGEFVGLLPIICWVCFTLFFSLDWVCFTD